MCYLKYAKSQSQLWILKLNQWNQSELLMLRRHSKTSTVREIMEREFKKSIWHFDNLTTTATVTQAAGSRQHTHSRYTHSKSWTYANMLYVISVCGLKGKDNMYRPPLVYHLSRVHLILEDLWLSLEEVSHTHTHTYKILQKTWWSSTDDLKHQTLMSECRFSWDETGADVP